MRPHLHRMELLTLSPVMVTAGREAVLSPYTDFVQDGNRLFYLDPRKVERALASAGSSVLEEFVRGIRIGMDNNRSLFNLRRFLRERLNREPAELALRSVAIHGQIGHAQLRRHVASAGRPFIPGSSLKGALCAGIYLDWLLSEKEGQAFIADLKREVDALWGMHQARLSEAEERFREGKKQEGRSISEPIHREARDTLRRFHPKALFGELEERDEHGRKRSSEMRFLRVSDTNPLSPEVVQVERIGRVKIRDASLVSPQWSEVIPRGTKLTFTLTIEPAFTQPGLTFLNNRSPQYLLNRLQDFADRVLEWEMAVLESVRDVENLGDVREGFEDLLSYEVPEKGAMLRIGGGKTYFDNSLGLALRSNSEETFERFRRLLGLGRNPMHQAFSSSRFPATRSYVRRDERCVRPLGWVQVQLLESRSG